MDRIKGCVRSIESQIDYLIRRELDKSKRNKLEYLKSYTKGILLFLDDELEKLLWKGD